MRYLWREGETTSCERIKVLREKKKNFLVDLKEAIFTTGDLRGSFSREIHPTSRSSHNSIISDGPQPPRRRFCIRSRGEVYKEHVLWKEADLRENSSWAPYQQSALEQIAVIHLSEPPSSPW